MSPGGLAVIAGVNRYVTARCTLGGCVCSGGDNGIDDYAAPSSEASIRVFSRYYGAEGRAVDLDSPDDIVTHSIALVCRVAASQGLVPAGAGGVHLPAPMCITIDSDLDDTDSDAKFGLGSSGAVAVAVTRALAALLGLKLEPMRVFKIAMVATLLAGAAGSGGDIACSAHGGVVLYRRAEPNALAELVATDPVVATDAPWPNLHIESRADLGGLNLLVGWTGSPVKTDSQLAKAGGNDGRFVAEATSISEKLWRALNSGDHVSAYECIRDNRALLKRYERERAVDIETEKLTALADIAEDCGAAGKSSGSGGGDCGIALASAEADGDLIADRWREAGIRPLPLRVAEPTGPAREA